MTSLLFFFSKINWSNYSYGIIEKKNKKTFCKLIRFGDILILLKLNRPPVTVNNIMVSFIVEIWDISKCLDFLFFSPLPLPHSTRLPLPFAKKKAKSKTTLINLSFFFLSHCSLSSIVSYIICKCDRYQINPPILLSLHNVWAFKRLFESFLLSRRARCFDLSLDSNFHQQHHLAQSSMTFLFLK